MDSLFTTHDVSHLLQVDPSTVSKWVDRGLLPAFKTPGGHRRIRSSALRAFVLAHGMPMPEELGGERIKLLFVDAHKPSLEALKRALRAFGSVELIHRPSPIDALLELDSLEPNVVLWDAENNEVDPLEVFLRLSARAGKPPLSVYAVLGGRSSTALETKLRKAGALEVVHKPFTAETLAHLLPGRTLPRE